MRERERQFYGMKTGDMNDTNGTGAAGGRDERFESLSTVEEGRGTGTGKGSLSGSGESGSLSDADTKKEEMPQEERRE